MQLLQICDLYIHDSPVHPSTKLLYWFVIYGELLMFKMT